MYSERAYFDGDHCQHCATRDEHMRLERIAAANRQAYKTIERRRGGRASPRLVHSA